MTVVHTVTEKEISVTTEDPFARDGGLPSMSFGGRDATTGAITRKPIGTFYEFVVTKAPVFVQSRDYDSKKPLFWKTGEKGVKTTDPNDQPVMSVVMHVKVTASSETTMTHKGEQIPVVGTEMAVWAEKPSSLFFAIGDAKVAAGGDPIAVGGKGRIEVTGFKQGENKQRMPATQFACTYKGPDVFAVDTTVPDSPAAIVPPPPPAAVPAPPVAAAVPPPPPPADPHKAEREAYLAGGWTLDLIAQHHPHLMPPVAAAVPPPPPAGVPAPPVDKKAAAIAQLTPEELAAIQ